jgi:UDP-N-acetyl-2-amino-2-deoxyglucuronate dehydrogenase
MNEGEKIKFAIVGLGHIGKRHGTIIRQHPECEWVAGCDIIAAAETGLNQYKPDFYFNAIEALLKNSPAFDVLSIATPNGLHEQHALMGLQAGKHVLIEKPMALTKAGCERIIAEAAQQQKMVFCVMQNRYSPVSVWLKHILETGKLGKIFMVEISCYWNRDERYYTKGNWHGTKKLDVLVVWRHNQFERTICQLYP